MTNDLGRRLKAARERAHLTQAELGQLLGVKGARTVRNWEKGKTDPRSHLTNIEDFIADVERGRLEAMDPDELAIWRLPGTFTPEERQDMIDAHQERRRRHSHGGDDGGSSQPLDPPGDPGRSDYGTGT